MKRTVFFALSAGAALGASSLAWGADMPRKAPYYKAPAPVAYDWTGFYAGVNVGYGVGRDPSSFVAPTLPSFETFDLAPAGVIGGIGAGYNWQLGNWVLGVEGDFQGSDQRDSQTCIDLCTPLRSLTVEQKLPWFATLRGRIGYATGPLLFYYTGGLAYGRVESNLTETAGAGTTTPFSFSTDRAGWTIGSGVEAALGGNWTGKVEYLYLDLGSVNNAFNFQGVTNTYSTSVRDNIFRAGLDYRFGGPAAPALATWQPPAFNWTGFYVGANVGTGVARNPTTANLAGNPERFNLTPNGWLGGVQAGYNWQNGHLVAGIETDVQWSGLSDSNTCLFTCTATQFATFDQKLEWFGTTRARLGYAMGPALFYATGGVAYGTIKTDIAANFGTGTQLFDFRETKTGWTAGGGVETPVSFPSFVPLLSSIHGLTSKTEYLYVDLGSTTDSFSLLGANPVTSSFHTHIIRTSLSYKFGAY